MLPQSKKDSKLDTKKNLEVLNELAELNNCNNVLFFEARRHEDLYLWTSRAPSGPSIKFHVLNIHTMSELKLTGNCLKGSRPILSFDSNFDSSLHYKLVKAQFEQIFCVPIKTRRSKPFFDHVMSFSIVDDKIWIRNYQISEKDPETGADLSQASDMSLVEIGPRFVLNVIRIFEGSFNGRTLFENPEFNTPTAIKSAVRRLKSQKYNNRVDSALDQKVKLAKHTMPQDPLKDVFQ
ncbi:Ribosome biogenesis protein BRX1 [Smittium culicis]|uniref:Ribosome biogenesis protein BRX1 n=1 Tax=Smittium culicis TaxID=133412 RepID=A0A1R1Y569_9FUNG|nr:Ribosome biogenesis protein BRX1 [Smittium culicis]